jgi:hypothetical protein
VTGPSSDAPKRTPRAVRWLAALAVLTTAGTYLAAQLDFVRRHRPGIAPERYLGPQLTQIWLPGLGLTLLFVIAALVVHRRSRC